MMRRFVALTCVLSLTIPVGAAAQGDEGDPPLPEPGFATGGEPGTCVRDERLQEGADPDPYGDRCSRLRFAYGPIVVQPGANTTYPDVKRIEKPYYDGYMTRIEPNLVFADGTSPDMDEMHLHHATWLSYPEYGNGPWFAAGEEKTIAQFPAGYGMPVRATDIWYMVHMIHNETPQAATLWITYDIDYVPAEYGEELDMKPIKPFWLDVWKNGRRATYPVFNTQPGYGGEITDPVTQDLLIDPDTGEPFTTKECTWPRDECARFDSWGEEDVGQGSPGNGKGTDIHVTPDMAGTLIGMGGHLHPGGLRIEIDNVRCIGPDDEEVSPVRPGNTITSWDGLTCPEEASEETVRIATSDANYFGRAPTSWNLRMAVTGQPFWEVNLRADTMLRINAVYETELGSWYEGMGIAVAYVHPDEYYGIDPFAEETTVVDDLPAEECWEQADDNTLCTRGVLTRDEHVTEAYGGEGEAPWSHELDDGPVTSDVFIGGFLYAPGNFGSMGATGIPTVPRDEEVTFWNLDAFVNIYHSVTACEYPCNGQTGADYPIADFGWGRPPPDDPDAPLTYDSGQLVRVNPVTGEQQILTSGLTNPRYLSVGQDETGEVIYLWSGATLRSIRGSPTRASAPMEAAPRKSSSSRLQP
jgi:hypothetical protein